ncbi:PREDICTED: uncharacterized protein LOC109186206 [Ipomoea nil]|uniref:uncharacterized protein LOC109186206 n=1 Tax=Ipomoea nil TaxID=35883 RepID=UPI000900E1AD|nr:PREDICTED: uncharacterized protein LOC109186206 [Ipomoea nil]
MAPDKSSGPDGFNPAFYQHFWSEIGAEVSHYVLTCIRQCNILVGINDAHITLIPKKSPPECMGDLRPIALCNVIYKVIAKMLATRLQSIIGDIISDTQSVFIPGRLITDNVLIASEVLHFLKHKQFGNYGWSALKLDMAKAYDRMEWSYLQEIMSRMGFAEEWINLVMMCVTTAHYRVIVNGELSDLIIPTRGLRQGDPLSPYLFIICAEATVEEAMVVKNCLLEYERMSGQAVNFSKSCIIFSRNVGVQTGNAVAATFGMHRSDSSGKYLGLPLGIGRNKKEVFRYIETKLQQRFRGWNNKILSRAGKEVLLKSIAQSLPTYTMSMYYLPITFCESLERLMNRFWWNAKGAGRKGANPSYCSRSILAGQAILKQGSFRRIGNGRQTRIWGDPWMPDVENLYPLTSRSEHHGSAMVSALIDSVSASWDIPLLNELFCARDVDLIVQLPVSPEYEGKWCWRGDLRGIFSVKQGYRLPMGNTDNGNSSFTAWGSIWSLRIPPKFLNFLWRCGRAILPVRTNLTSRGIPIDHTCPLCQLYPETVLHLMRDCPYTRDLWNDVPPIITSANSDSLEEWLAGWLGAKDTEVKHVFVARCWTVWKAMNDFVWSHIPWSLEGVMAQVNNLLESWQTTNSSTTHVHVNGPTIVDNGVTPQALYFINVDATIFAERNEGGVAAVVHDRQGTFIAGRNKTVRCLQDPHLAEAMGIKEALSCAMECGWRNLVILSDCQLVCSSLRSSALYNSYAGCVLNDCFSLKRQFDYVSFRFIYRSANKIAHVLARDASSLSGPRSWFSDYPLCIQ